MTDFERLLYWLKGTQKLLDDFNESGLECPDAIENIKRLLLMQLSKERPICDEAFSIQIEKELSQGLQEALGQYGQCCEIEISRT